MAIEKKLFGVRNLKELLWFLIPPIVAGTIVVLTSYYIKWEHRGSHNEIHLVEKNVDGGLGRFLGYTDISGRYKELPIEQEDIPKLIYSK